MKRAVITRFNTLTIKYVLNPLHTLKSGGGCSSPPYITLDNPSYEEIANELLNVLNLSKTDFYPKENELADYQEFLIAAGVKNMKSSFKNSQLVTVFVNENEITFTPSDNKGNKKGYIGLIKERVIIDGNSTKEKISEAIRISFQKCS